MPSDRNRHVSQPSPPSSVELTATSALLAARTKRGTSQLGRTLAAFLIISELSRIRKLLGRGVAGPVREEIDTQIRRAIAWFEHYFARLGVQFEPSGALTAVIVPRIGSLGRVLDDVILATDRAERAFMRQPAALTLARWEVTPHFAERACIQLEGSLPSLEIESA